jgi:hypothetical protein
MRGVGVSTVAMAAFSVLLLSTACSEPPQKEIDRAQGAIEAARAAGADQYAREPFAAATTAMQETHDAVQQRDYRLALSRAIDANDRALEAARQAASGKALARSQAEAAIGRMMVSIRQLDERLKAAEASRLAARDTESARRTRTDADRALQEARAALGAEDYLGAMAPIKEVGDRIAKEIQTLNEALDARSARGKRRR